MTNGELSGTCIDGDGALGAVFAGIEDMLPLHAASIAAAAAAVRIREVLSTKETSTQNQLIRKRKDELSTKPERNLN